MRAPKFVMPKIISLWKMTIAGEKTEHFIMTCPKAIAQCVKTFENMGYAVQVR
ncbi:MAG: hypothetical protein JRC86_00590 [Deltaproteobacteria bacterium]|nr:hypothetical protein [Deltaproteobacteria bacterium]